MLRGGRIEAILDAGAAPPAGARVLALPGRTVMPGLVGMHNHLMYTASLNLDEDDKLPPPGFFVTEIAFSAPRMYLAAGVTTMRTTGSVEPYTDLNIRQRHRQPAASRARTSTSPAPTSKARTAPSRR